MPTRAVGALGPAAAAPRAAEPRLQCHQVHRDGQGAARRAPARRPAQRRRCATPAPASPSPSARSSSRSSSGWRRRRARCGASGSACRSSSASARCWAIAIGPAIGAGPRLDVLGGAAAGRAESVAQEPATGRDAVGRTHRRACACCASTTSRRCCAACRRCSRAGAAAVRHGAERGRGRRAAARGGAQCRTSSSPTTISTRVRAWRRWRRVRAAARVAGAGHRHNRRSLRRGAARGAPARITPCCASRSRRRRCARSCISSPGSARWRPSSPVRTSSHRNVCATPGGPRGLEVTGAPQFLCHPATF